MPMTDMFFTALSAVLISNRVLQMPLAIGSVLVTERPRGSSAGPLFQPFRSLPMALISTRVMTLTFLGFNAMIKA